MIISEPVHNILKGTIMKNLSAVLTKFGITAPVTRCERIREGHINDTYKIYSDDDIFILQKINTEVFREPEKVMHNIDCAQRLFKQGLQSEGKYNSRKFPEYLKSGNKNYLSDDGFWRVYRYIESVSLPPDCKSVRAFGGLLGEFHRYTESADISGLYTTIPDFHSIEKNISAVLQCDGEAQKIFSSLLDYFVGHKNCLSAVRLVHNDVKWGNVLISPETHLPETLIDYDTVMPGYAAFDFGDGVRSACVTENSEPDLKLIECFAEGYFSQYSGLGTQEAVLGIIAVAGELSARYLCDILTQKDYFANLTDSEKSEKYLRNLHLAKSAFEMREEIAGIVEKARG